jgi:hypothetical protein
MTKEVIRPYASAAEKSKHGGLDGEQRRLGISGLV